MITSGSDDRVSRMSRQDRPIDSDFQTTEFLYRRCVAKDIDPQYPDRLYPDQIAFYPNWSVNREKYSEWDDVLYPDHIDCGVARFRMKDVPARLESEGGIWFHWEIRHQPLEDNYAHSEVWSFKDMIHIPNDDNQNVKLPVLVKKRFRQLLSERAKVIRGPVS